MNRDQNARSVRVVIKFSPKQADVHVNRASGGAPGIEFPDLRENFISRNGCAGLARQAGQQRSFTDGEFAPAPATMPDLAPHPIHHDIQTDEAAGGDRN